jgi:hypothetical protein
VTAHAHTFENKEGLSFLFSLFSFEEEKKKKKFQKGKRRRRKKSGRIAIAKMMDRTSRL